MTKIPQISLSLQQAHSGEAVAIVKGEIVAFAADSYEAEKKALKKGFRSEEVMTTFIMGTKNYAV